MSSVPVNLFINCSGKKDTSTIVTYSIKAYYTNDYKNSYKTEEEAEDEIKKVRVKNLLCPRTVDIQ